jgi:hypothetical protein
LVFLCPNIACALSKNVISNAKFARDARRYGTVICSATVDLAIVRKCEIVERQIAKHL